jgi:CxxC motif-containing protein
VEVAMLQIFSYFVKHVTEANQIVVIAKFIIKKWEQIVVMTKPLRSKTILQDNVQELQKKVYAAKIRQPIPTDDVIYINFFNYKFYSV